MLTARDYEQLFTSENFPSDYPNNQTCQWSISAAAGYSVNLIVTDLRLAAGDTVTVRAVYFLLCTNTHSTYNSCTHMCAYRLNYRPVTSAHIFLSG